MTAQILDEIGKTAENESLLLQEDHVSETGREETIYEEWGGRVARLQLRVLEGELVGVERHTEDFESQDLERLLARIKITVNLVRQQKYEGYVGMVPPERLRSDSRVGNVALRGDGRGDRPLW